jgi:arthrofactin-type cyclic lipopeptide synthetase C
MTVTELLNTLSHKGIDLWAEEGQLYFASPDANTLDAPLREAIAKNRNTLLEMLSAVRRNSHGAPLAKAPAGAQVQCSHAQERFLFSAELDGTSDQYRLDAAFRIKGKLDVAALRRSIQDIVRRHEILRIRFEVRDTGFGMVPTEWEPALEIVDYQGNEADLVADITRQSRTEFDLKQGPHLLIRLYRLSAAHFVLLISIHHIVSDGGSIAVFARELQNCYAWHAGFANTPPNPPEYQFRDFAFSERSISAEEQQQHLRFWRDELKDAPALLNLPTDRPRPALRGGAGGRIPIELDPALWHRMRNERKKLRVSDFQLIVAAFWLLLHKYSNQQSIVIGTPWRNRERLGSENLIGPLLNLLPLYIRPRPGANIGELLNEVRIRTLAAIEHGSVPFEQIVAQASPERSAAYTPIFQVICAIESTPQEAVHLTGVTIEALELPNEAARYDLALVLQPQADRLLGALKYDKALFDENTAASMAFHLTSALELMLQEPDKTIERVQLVTPTERELLIDRWNRTDREYPLEKTLVDLFHERVAESSERVAVECGNNSLSYRELDCRANLVAHRLRTLGVSTDDIVGITLERSIDFVIAVLGVLKSGAAYLPIDAKHPPERRTWMMQNAAVKAVIGPSLLPIPQVSVSNVLNAADDAIALDRRARPDAGCYVIYTSGSTGVPKGVVVTHRAIANNLLWMNDEWPLTAQDAVLFKSSAGFDVSVKEIFWPLIAGARLVLAAPGASADPEQLNRVIRDHRVTVIHMVPTVLDFFLRHDDTPPIEHLRIVMCGGEALTPTLRARFHARFKALLLHLYGPTEAAIAVTGYEISAEHAEVDRLPLGRPMPNCHIYIVDDFHQLAPVGVPGELCISGVPLARGYLNRPDLTAENFIPDPFSGVPGSRMYLTGDRARWRPDGQIEYLGRIDRQIKLGGFRIELGEIEAVLRKQHGIDDALVVVRETEGNRTLVAYVASQSSAISTNDLQQRLRAQLPAFMVPASFVIVPVFPANLNGKIDAASLPVPDAAPQRSANNPPQGDLEKKIAKVWCETLNLKAVDRDEDFFDLGGHSLLILQLQARLRQHLRENVSVTDLLLHTTVENLAAHLVAARKRKGTKWLKKMSVRGKSSVN